MGKFMIKRKFRPVYEVFLDYVKAANLSINNPKGFVTELFRLIYIFKAEKSDKKYLLGQLPNIMVEILPESEAVEAIDFYSSAYLELKS